MLAEIARQLVSDPNTDPGFIQTAFGNKHVEVRKAVVNNAPLNDATAETFKSALKDSSYNIVETALLKLWAYYPFNKASLLDNIKNLDGQAMALKVRYLELGTEAFPDMKESMIASLAVLCGNQYEFRTRINAMQALQRLNACNKVVISNLFDAMLNFNSRLNAPAKDVLVYFKQQTQNLALMKEVLRTGKYTDEERTKLSKALDI